MHRLGTAERTLVQKTAPSEIPLLAFSAPHRQRVMVQDVFDPTCVVAHLRKDNDVVADFRTHAQLVHCDFARWSLCCSC